jgi:hypothetical protein
MMQNAKKSGTSIVPLFFIILVARKDAVAIHMRMCKVRLQRAACATGDRAQDSDQDTCTDEGYDNAVNDVAAGRKAKSVHNEAADKRAHDANNNITNDAITATAHHNARQETGDQANDDPEK